MGMATATAVALACYAVGLFARASTRRNVIILAGSRAAGRR